MAHTIDRMPRRFAPWRVKLGVKVAVGLLPIPYSLWRRTGLFRHGEMLNPEYARQVVRNHTARAALAPGFVALELGPGDSLASGIVASSLGASRTWLVDTGRFAEARPDRYRRLWTLLASDPASSLGAWPEPTDLLDLCSEAQITYLAGGLRELEAIPPRSVDVAWSHAVLEHVRRAEMPDLFTGLVRIMRHTGTISHRVDLADHLTGGLRNLTVPSSRWERPLVWRSGAYTNRMSVSEIIAAAELAGFETEIVDVDHWREQPISRGELATEFRNRSDDELRVRAFDFIARPKVS
jgi:hypothetical protein